MELFNEWRNIWLHKVYEIVWNIYEGKRTYTPEDIRQDLQLNYYLQADGEIQQIINIIKHLPVRPTSFGLPPEPVTVLEKSWLKTMLQEEEFSFLISPALREKLLTALQDIPTLLQPGDWQKIQLQRTPKDTLQQLLRTYYEALLQDVQIKWTTTDGITYQGSPIRLEYDIAANQYALWVWPENEETPQKHSLTQIESIEKTAAPREKNIEEKWQQYLKDNQCTIRLKLTPKNTAVERCFRLFATYDKIGTVSETLDTYHLTVHYYAFDKQEVIEKILSLGNTVTVLEPQELRQEIITILQKAKHQYEA